jgi:hypothetical protein
MLIAHRTIKSALRNLITRRFEMNGAESLVGFVLAKDILRE